MLRRSALAAAPLLLVLPALSCAQSTATGVGLLESGLQVLRLALLGLVLFLVAARLRVVFGRRRSQTALAPDGLPPAAPDVSAFSGDAEEPACAPEERAPAGLLPSTATAKLRARRHERVS